MIVFDENIHQESLMKDVARWYRGKVLSIRDLRPGTFIKDEDIPHLLQRRKKATFITINVADFWKPRLVHAHYSIVCLSIPNDQLSEIPQLLKRLFRLPQFQTKSARMGKVVLVSKQRIQYYEVGKRSIQTMRWPE
jgi:hypothetical protein